MDKLEDTDAIEVMKKMGFVHSTLQNLLKDQEKNQLKGFSFDQVAMFQDNLKTLDKRIPKHNRFFYVVKLSNKINDIRAWGWL